MESLKMQKWISVLILGIGLMVLLYGVLVEGEPTLVALLLITCGAVWFFITRARSKSHHP